MQICILVSEAQRIVHPQQNCGSVGTLPSHMFAKIVFVFLVSLPAMAKLVYIFSDSLVE